MTTVAAAPAHEQTSLPAGRLAQDAATVRAYLLSGEARLTVISRRSEDRFTFKVAASADGETFFVRVLTGSQNDDPGSWSFLGNIWEGVRYAHNRHPNGIGDGAPSAVAFRWVWDQVARGELVRGVDLYHDGRCGRCRRLLTVPGSVASGLGPECARRDRRAQASETASLLAAAPPAAPAAPARRRPAPPPRETTARLLGRPAPAMTPAETASWDRYQHGDFSGGVDWAGVDAEMDRAVAEAEAEQERAGFESDPDYQASLRGLPPEMYADDEARRWAAGREQENPTLFRVLRSAGVI